MAQTISYAQRYEDMHLMRCFERQRSGFYIDIGAGHPVYDNVSFAFYLRGWRGITVEPNPWLTQLSEAVRPRDTRVPSLIGAADGEATYYLVEDFHGLSTTIASHAHAAEREFGKRSTAMTMPVTTLQALCERHVQGEIDFLKIDVEGGERAVIEGGHWRRFRPKVVVLEALTPVSLAPAWRNWGPLLTSHGYRFAYFDGLNSYYAAEEHDGLAAQLSAAPKSFPSVAQFRNFKPALDDAAHPDHRLAKLLSGQDMVRLPLVQADELSERLAALDPDDPSRPAGPDHLAAVHQRLFGEPPPPDWGAALALPPHGTMRDAYRRIAASEPFRAACGRISASSAW